MIKMVDGSVYYLENFTHVRYGLNEDEKKEILSDFSDDTLVDLFMTMSPYFAFVLHDHTDNTNVIVYTKNIVSITI